MTTPLTDIIEVRAGAEEENAGNARLVREYCAGRGVFLVNLMASPGAGKTTVLRGLIALLKDEFDIGVIEADVDSDVDARAVAAAGARAVQLHTGGSCHMDAAMTLRGLEALEMQGAAQQGAGEEAQTGAADRLSQGEGIARCPLPELVFLENIGNLVCPAEFDVGADLKLMILSVPEGDDKPLKYPLMFTVSDCLLINKTDTAPIFDFDIGRCAARVHELNADMPIFPVSAKNGEGLEAFAGWLRERIAASRRGR